MTVAPPGRAARLHGRRDIRLGESARPESVAGRVRVRVRAVGLCGSDLHWWDEGSIGDTRLSAPLVLGHELSGVIEDGPRTGERVVVDPAEPCASCPVCLSGRGRLCPAVRFLGLDPLDGALQTWVSVAASRCVALPASITDDDAVLLEVLGIALHALDLAAVQPGMTAGVYGCGPIGQLVIRALRAAGIRDIVASDPLAHRVEAARASGAGTGVVVPGGGEEDPAAAIPVDVAFECSGEDAAVATAVRAARPGGSVLLMGIPPGETTIIPASPVRRKELRLQAVRRMEATDLPRAVDEVVAGRISLDGLVTARYPLDEVATAFRTAAARDGLKVVVQPGAPG